MFQRHTQITSQIKKLSSESSGIKVILPQGKVCLLEYEMPISFQARVTTSQANFLKIP